MNFTTYLKKKLLLMECYNETLSVLSNLENIRLEGKLREELKLLENESFTLVVIGEFSRGKSTFVNAMLGKAILPSSKSATTNVISKIVYGDRPNFTLYYKDGALRQVSEDEFSAIKAQAEENPSKFQQLKNFVKINALTNTVDFSNIDHAVVSYPLSFCQNNVEVVDTPGTNDLNVGRMEITYNYLKKAEAAILVLSATQPLTKSEKEFLQEQVIGNQIKDIFIVINFKDEVAGEEDKVRRHILENLRDLDDFSKRCFLVSSRQALIYRRKENGELLKGKTLMDMPESLNETGFPAFEVALGNFLSEEKGLAKLTKYVQCCNLALMEAEHALNVKEEASSLSADEIKTMVAREQLKYRKTKSEILRIAKNMQAKLLIHESELEHKASMAANRIKQAAVDSIDGYTRDMTAKQVQYLVEKAVTPIQKKIIEEVNDYQSQVVKDEAMVAVQELRRFWDDIEFDASALPIASAISNALSIEVGTTKKQEDNANFKRALGSYAVAVLAGGGVLGLAAAAAAWFITGGGNPFDGDEEKVAKLKRQVRKQYTEKLANFSEGICKQYRKSVDEICTAMQKEVDDRIDTMDEQMQQLLSRQEAKETDVAKEQEMLRKQRATINDIRRSLQEVIR